MTTPPFSATASPVNPIMMPEPAIPLVTVSASKVFRYKPFTMCITIDREWAIRVGDDAVMRAGLGARCIKEGDPTAELKTCHCSGGKRVVEVGVGSRKSFGPHSSADSSMVTYAFENCRSHCSSSRDHLHSRVVLVISDLAGLPYPVISPPISLHAREKHKLASPGTVTTAAVSSPSRARATDQAVVPLASAERMVPLMLLSPTMDARSLMGGMPAMVVVRVFKTVCGPSQMNVLISDFLPFISALPGFVDFRCRMVPGFVVSFSYFQNQDTAERSSQVVSTYTAGHTNLLKTNLNANGMAILVCQCTSY
eukprot:m51a1_g11055 hypothetical protein (310) ;mRNA; f:514509-515740